MHFFFILLHKNQRTQTDIKGGKYSGFIDFGGEVNLDGNETLAKETLVFMLVGLKKNWKWPIAYFLIDKCNSDIMAQLIKPALILAADSNIQIWGITCDGTMTNLCTIEEKNFTHPTKAYKVYFVPDACHNLKLARNALASYKTFQYNKNNISWQYIQDLYELQSNITLKFANKISKKHIDFQKNVMNVSIAAQIFSSSVASAINFLRQNYKFY